MVNVASWIRLLPAGRSGRIRPRSSRPWRRGRYVALAVGDCLLMPENEEIASVESADCEEPHELEVFALVSLPEGNDAPYPGDLELAELMFEQCLNQFESYVRIA